ncbi:MAG: RDD family protein [Actinomadura sp.]
MGVGPAGREPAEPAQRLVARIVDTFVVGLPVVAAAYAALPRATAEIVVPIGVAAVSLMYESIQLALWGRTLGKRLSGVVVVSEDGRMGVTRALVRAAVYAFPIALRPVPVLGAIAGIFWVANVALMFERPARRALHDRIARTRVVGAAS